MKKLFSFVLLAASLLMTSCTSIPMASSTDDLEAKQFTPVQNKSVIYIYRNEIFGGAVGMDISFNGQEMGGTTANKFLRIVAKPGDHLIASRAENRDVLKLKSEAGKIYYVWQEAKMGVLSARTKLSLVSDQVGQRGVMQCDLVDHLQPESD